MKTELKIALESRVSDLSWKLRLSGLGIVVRVSYLEYALEQALWDKMAVIGQKVAESRFDIYNSSGFSIPWSRILYFLLCLMSFVKHPHAPRRRRPPTSTHPWHCLMFGPSPDVTILEVEWSFLLWHSSLGLLGSEAWNSHSKGAIGFLSCAPFLSMELSFVFHCISMVASCFFLCWFVEMLILHVYLYMYFSFPKAGTGQSANYLAFECLIYICMIFLKRSYSVNRPPVVPIVWWL